MGLPAQRIDALRTPASHYAAVVSDQRSHHLLWLKGRKETDGKEWYRIDKQNAAAELSRHARAPDVYFTPNEFYDWRLVRLLAGLNAFWVDVDAHDDPDADPASLVWRALEQLDRARIPTPNLVVYTGRGAHLYWLFQRTPAAALPRWQAVQRRLVEIAGGDTQAIDVTRVLRLVGTTNSLAADCRRTVTGEVLRGQRYDFGFLCDEILRFTRAEIRDLRAARAKQLVAPASTKVRGRPGSMDEVWYRRYQDILKIISAHWANGVPPGHRDAILFHLANALSWFVRSEALEDEIRVVAKQIIPTFDQADVDNTVTSIARRAKDAAAGRLYDFGCEKVDPRYRYTSERLWECFKPLVVNQPGLIEQLQVIVPTEIREAREKLRQRGRDRVAEGRYQLTRQQYLAGAAERQAEVIRRHDAGEPLATVCKDLAISERTARSYLAKVSRVARSAPVVTACGPQPTSPRPNGQPDVQKLRAEGKSIREIASLTGISKSQVSRLLNVPRLQCAPP